MGLAPYKIATYSASGHCHESAAISIRIFLSVAEPIRYESAPGTGKKNFQGSIYFFCFFLLRGKILGMLFKNWMRENTFLRLIKTPGSKVL